MAIGQSGDVLPVAGKSLDPLQPRLFGMAVIDIPGARPESGTSR